MKQYPLDYSGFHIHYNLNFKAKNIIDARNKLNGSHKN